MDIGIQNLLSREQNIHVSLFKTYLDKLHKFIFQKGELKVLFWAKKGAAICKICKCCLLIGWENTLFHFVRINKINVFTGHLPQKTKDIFLTPEVSLHQPWISIGLCVYVKPKPISSESTSHKKKLTFPYGMPWKYQKYKQKTVYKNFIETVSHMHERIRKFRALGTNKQVSSSSTCKYILLRKADTFLESLYHPGKVSRLMWVQELRCRKCILYSKNQIYVIN